MRGRRRNSSWPRISNHRSLTGFTLVKNRWPPMSKRQPSRTAVLADAADDVVGLEDGRRHPALGEHVGGGEAGGPGADDDDFGQAFGGRVGHEDNAFVALRCAGRVLGSPCGAPRGRCRRPSTVLWRPPRQVRPARQGFYGARAPGRGLAAASRAGHTRPRSTASATQGTTSSRISSRVVVASKPRRSRALATEGTRAATSCANGSSHS